MSLQTTLEVEYPETDGQPMGETEWHIHWIIRLRDLLKTRYRDQKVLVASDMFVYYEEGVPRRCFAADAMVVKDCDPYPRPVFKIWEEGRVPCAIFEIVSASTRTEDLDSKPGIYERLGVGDYFLYDPLGEEIRPQLQGFRLSSDGYEPIRPDDAGRLHSVELGIWLRVEDGDLVLYDVVTGKKLLTEAEREHAALEAERSALESERAAREAAEAEVRRLQKELRRRGAAPE
jgi:Uma2 family endonuclease